MSAAAAIAGEVSGKVVVTPLKLELVRAVLSIAAQQSDSTDLASATESLRNLVIELDSWACLKGASAGQELL